jgi:hypothetical protein
MKAESSFALNVLASKRLPQPIRFPFTAYSHKHDLLAIVSATSEVHVFRIISGQVAFVISPADSPLEPDIQVTALAWKPDGTSLGVGWSNGKYGIYDGTTGRSTSLVELETADVEEEYALNLVPSGSDADVEARRKQSTSTVVCLGFMGHSTAPKQGSGGKTLEGKETTEDWFLGHDLQELDDNDDNDDGGIMALARDAGIGQLPRSIAALDVTGVLPRLSTIPAHTPAIPMPALKTLPHASNFSSQAATDTHFDAQRALPSTAIESLLVCQEDRTVQVLLDETVKIGTCLLGGKPLRHAAYAQSPTHAILCEHEQSASPLRVHFLELPLSTLSGPLLHVMTTNTKRIQTLLEYIVQTVRCIERDYRLNAKPPSQFIAFLQDELEVNYPADGDAVANVYHLAMTGSFHPQVKKWLEEEIIDSTVARWQQSLSTLYANIQAHLFVNLLPALDRFSIALTVLRGQATFHEGASEFDCHPRLFSRLLENVDSLRLVAQKLLLIVQAESRESKAFHKWLKLQKEIIRAGISTPGALEIEERESPAIDYPLLLSYIKNHMKASDLSLYIDPRPTSEAPPPEDDTGADDPAARAAAPAASDRPHTTDAETFFQTAHIRDMTYARTAQALAQLDAALPLALPDVEDPASLLNLPALTCGLVGRVRDLLARITAWQNRVVFAPVDPPSVELPLDPASFRVADLIMAPDARARGGGCCTSILALAEDGRDTVRVFDIVPGTQGKRSAPASTASASYEHASLREEGVVVGGEVLDVKFMPRGEGAGSVFLCLFRPHGDSEVVQIARYRIDGPGSSGELLHNFLPDTSFRAETMLVGGRKGKMVCIVFGKKGREWRVLDLDGPVQMGGDEGDDGDSDVEM